MNLQLRWMNLLLKISTYRTDLQPMKEMVRNVYSQINANNFETSLSSNCISKQ
jgi:hypothetical protein